MDDDGYRFAHALIRDTVLDTQPAGRRTELHQRAATALEDRLEGCPRGTRRARRTGRRPLGPGAGQRPPRRRASRPTLRVAQPASSATTTPQSLPMGRDLGDDSLDTLTELGEAQVLAGRLADGRETLATAAVRAVTERRGEALATAVLAAGSGVGGYEVDVRDHQQVPRLRDALSLLGDDDSRLRSAALARTALVDTSLTVERRAALAETRPPWRPGSATTPGRSRHSPPAATSCRDPTTWMTASPRRHAWSSSPSDTATQ